MDLFEDISDRELWVRAAEHDGEAFEELFRRHGPAIYNHCFRRTASWSTAEELTSVVFLQAWRKRRKVRFYSDSVLPWLLAVANNVLRDTFRSQRRQRRLLAKVPPLPPVTFEEDASQRLDDERRMAQVLESVRSLRLEEQEVIRLCNWTGLSQSEAAAILGIPAGTVRSRLARAHDHIRTGAPPGRSGVPFPNHSLKEEYLRP